MTYHSLILDGLAIAASLNALGGRLLLEEFNPEDPRHLWEVTSHLPLLPSKEPNKKVFDVSESKYEAGTLVSSYETNKGLNQNFAFTADGKRAYPEKAPKLFVTRSGADVILYPYDPKDTSQVITKIPEGTYVKNLFSNTGEVEAKIIFPFLAKNKIVQIPAGAKDVAVFSIVNSQYSFVESTTDFVFDGEVKTTKNTGAGARVTISVRKPRATKVIAKVEAGNNVNTPNLTWKTDDGSVLDSYEIVQKEPLPQKVLKKATGNENLYQLEVEANVEYRFYVEGTAATGEKFRSELQRVFVSGSLQLEHTESTTESVTISWKNSGASFFFESFTVLMNGKIIAENLKPVQTSFVVTKAHGVDQQDENYFVVEGKTKSGRTIISNEISAGLIKKPRETKVILKVVTGSDPNKPNVVELNWSTDDGSDLASYNIVQKEPAPKKVVKTEKGNVHTTTTELEANVDYIFVVEGISEKDKRFVSEPEKANVKGALELKHKGSTGESITVNWENTGALFNFESFTVKMNGKVIASNVTTSPFTATQGLDDEDENKFVVEGKTKSGKIIVSNIITAGLGFSVVKPITGTTGGMK